jgi:hypothetical protein
MGPRGSRNALFICCFYYYPLPILFLPFAIAFYKKRVNTGAIFALNLFLGWTLIGWVISLVWALKDEHII